MVPSLTPMVLLVVGSTLVCVHPHTPIGLGMWVCHTTPLCSPHALTGFVGHSQGPAAGSQARRVQTGKSRENRDISPSPGRGEFDPEDVCPVRVRSMWSRKNWHLGGIEIARRWSSRSPNSVPMILRLPDTAPFHDLKLAPIFDGRFDADEDLEVGTAHVLMYKFAFAFDPRHVLNQPYVFPRWLS